MSKFETLYSKESLSDISYTLITIEGASSDVIRLTDDNIEHTYGGNVYLPYYYQLNLPDVSQNSVNQGSIVFSNVSSEIIAKVRQKPRDVTLKIDTMYLSNGDNVEFQSTRFKLGNIVLSQSNIAADLIIDTVLNDNVPSLKMSIINCPGIS